MYSISPASTGKQIIRYLENLSKNEVVAVCAYLNNRTEYSVPVYGSKAQLLMGLRGVDRGVLFDAVETLFNPCQEEEGEDLDEEEDDDWDEQEDNDSEEEEEDDSEEE